MSNCTNEQKRRSDDVEQMTTMFSLFFVTKEKKMIDDLYMMRLLRYICKIVQYNNNDKNILLI